MTSVALESIIAIDGQRRLRRLGAACVVLLVCTLALFVTGFFDAQRFIEGAPAIQQLASEMVPPTARHLGHVDCGNGLDRSGVLTTRVDCGAQYSAE